MITQLTLIASGTTALFGFLVAATIVRGLVRAGRLRSSGLGLATAATFAVLGAGGLIQVTPWLAQAGGASLAAGAADGLAAAVLATDVAAAGLAAYYLALRPGFGTLTQAAWARRVHGGHRWWSGKRVPADPVTGLGDRDWAMVTLERDLATSGPGNVPVSVLVIKLENIGDVERRYGTEIHHRLMGDVGAILRDQLRSSDLAAAYADEEFILVLPGAGSEIAARVARRFEKQVQHLMTSNLIDLPVMVCAGSATSPVDAVRAPQLVAAAAEMMDYARRLGGGCFAYSHDTAWDAAADTEDEDQIASSAAEVTVRALRGALAAHEPGIARHADRVAEYAAALAPRAGFPAEDLPLLRAAGLLHDVGMLETDPAILRKPGRLTADEYVQVRRHPQVGYEILRSTPWLQPVATYVRYHHERFDGHGYPEGLQGQEIPLASRILAVVEAYDSMRTTWSYRKRLSVEVAIERLVAGSGSLYDPEIVGAMIALVEFGFDPSRAPGERAPRPRRRGVGQAPAA